MHQDIPRPRRLIGLAIAIALLTLAPGTASSAAAQDNGSVVASPDLDVQAITARLAVLKEIEDRGELTQSQSQELSLLREADQFVTIAGEAVASADRFMSEARTAPELAGQIDAYLARPIDELVTPVDRTATLDELNTQLESTRVRRQTEQELRAKVDSDEVFRAERRAAIPADRTVATERLDALNAELAAGSAPLDTPEITDARRWRALAEQFAHRATLRAIDEELRNYDARRTLLDKRRAYRDQRIAVEVRNIANLDAVISERQIAQAQEAEDAAERQRRDAANSHAIVQSILDANQLLAGRNTEILELARIDAATKLDADAALTEWEAAYERSQARLERAGLTNAIGQHLRNQHSRLPEIRDLRRSMSERDRLISRLVNEVEDHLITLETLADVDDAAQRLLDDSQDPLPASIRERDDLKLAIRSALLSQREFLRTLTTSTNSYLDDTVFELQNTQRELADLLDEYSAFIDERILWIRSAEVVGIDDARTAVSSLDRLLDQEAWGRVGTAVWSQVRDETTVGVIWTLLLVALWISQPLLRRRLYALSERTRRYSQDRISLTIVAIALSVALAIALPASLAVIGWGIGSASTDPLAIGLAAGLLQAAELLFAAELIRILCKPNGVGDAHFRWNPDSLRLVRWHLRWLVPVVIPLTFVVGVTSADDQQFESVGRLAFMARMVAFAVFLKRVFALSGEITGSVLASQRGGWFDRLKYLWYPLLIAVPIATAVAAALGYFYSAVQVEERVLASIWLLLLVIVGRAVLLRGLSLAQRKLALEQRRKKRATAPPATPSVEATHPIPDITTEALPKSVPELEEIDVAAISAQTRQLVNATVVASILIGFAVVWVDMMPALGFFREFELWAAEPAVAAETATDDAASATAEPVVEGDAGVVTLGHIIYAAMILLMTALVSRNTPGLLEIVLLQRLPISPSGRYAITTIVRYILVIVGAVWAFATIGIGWSKVQWLVAAMTVGLGFGLQEIFANFVSGLIILFERPVRVGDTVTVGGITGTVAKLRIRATTIVDWDRKELIIPNKEFVTGQIVNWTLSDPITRVVIPVGIAYGSDTAKAEELLLQVARDEPIVLDEPEPTVVFSRFGESSLDFSLRVFIPHIDNLMGVRHRIHNAIDHAFDEAGIVIAFPQRDVHIHRGDAES